MISLDLFGHGDDAGVAHMGDGPGVATERFAYGEIGDDEFRRALRDIDGPSG